MPRIKVIIQEEKQAIAPHPQGGEMYIDESEWVVMHDVTSSDKAIIGGALRAIANSYDPPKANYRGTD
jgi:hypothetical protein